MALIVDFMVLLTRCIYVRLSFDFFFRMFLHSFIDHPEFKTIISVEGLSEYHVDQGD